MVRLRRGVPSWCLRVSLFVLLFTSLLIALPPPLAAQAVRYESDALGRLTVVSPPEGRAIGATEGPTCGGPLLALSLIVLSGLGSRAIPGRGPLVEMPRSTGSVSRTSSDEGKRL